MADMFASQLIRVSKSKQPQSADQESFVGGRPKIPVREKAPVCRNCGAVQSFFFQVAFPPGHIWSGQTLAVFGCNACEFDPCPVPKVNQIFVPYMKRMDLRSGEDLPDGALDLYQKTCRFLAFPTVDGVIREDYPKRVQYRPIALDPVAESKPTAKSMVGGWPGWVSIKMTPGMYLGEPLEFLMQWRHGYEFDIVPGAPPPYHPFLEEVPALKQIKQYRLFQGTQLYFFGNRAQGRPQVFMLAMRA
jgi:hypothetical protein